MPKHGLTLTEASALLRNGKLTSVELVTDLLDRADSHSHLNAFSELDRETILKAAKTSDDALAAGHDLPILHGLPISLKDNIASIGSKMQANTPALSNFRPKADAAVVEKLKAAGAIIFGKNTMHEIAFGGTSNNSFGGPVRNAVNPERIPGGSSGGTASAVGASLVPAGIGSDTGGSVRVPAAFNGVCGYRPSTGRWSGEGVLPLSSTRDTLGPLARSVADIDLIDRAVVGRDAASPKNLSDLRLGKPTAFYWENLAPDVRAASEEALKLLSEAGVTFVDIDLSTILGKVHEVAFPIVFYEAIPMLCEYLESWETGLTVDQLLDNVASPDVAAVAKVLRDPQQAVSDEFYRHAKNEIIPAIARGYANILSQTRLDGIVFPTSPITAPPVGDDETTLLNGELVPTFLTVIRHMDLGTIIALPSLSLPIGTDRDGLPIGLTVEGKHDGDEDLISIAMALETVLSAPRKAN